MTGAHEDPAAPPGADQAEEGAAAAAATTGRSVLTGGLWYLGSYVVPQAYTIVVSLVAARFLGPSGMGLQSYISFVSVSLTTVLSSSVYLALMRYVGESVGQGRRDLLPGLLGWAWRIEAVAAAVGAGVLVAVALLGADPKGAWAFSAVVCAAAVLHTVPTAVLIGLQQFRRASVVGLTTGLVGTLAIVGVLWAGGGITGMFAVEAVVAVANLIWTGSLARGSLRAAAPGPDAEARSLRRRVGRYALFASIGLLLELIVGTRFEFFFLERFSTHPDIAFYSIAFSAVSAARLVPRALGSSTAPAFATLYGAGALDRMRSGFSRSLRLLLLVTLPLTAAGIALGPELVRLVYGGDYAGVSEPLRILFAGFPVIALSSLAGALLAGLGRIKLPLAANAVAAAVDVGLAAALIPHLDAAGAALANVAGEGTYVLIVLVLAAREVGGVDARPLSIVRTVAVSLAAGLAGWAVLDWIGGLGGLCAGAVAASAVFVAGGWALRIVSADDARWIDESFGRRLWGSVGLFARLWSPRPAVP